VDQVEVDVLEPEPVQALVESLQRRVVPLLGVPQLGRDEDLLARQPRGSQRGADALLVPVGGGGVDVSVAGFERLLDHILGLGWRDLEDAKAKLGYLGTVTQGPRRNRTFGHAHSFALTIFCIN
jgi:hypothetical protein